MFLLTACGYPQMISRSGTLSEPQESIDQHAVDKGLLDDADPAIRSCDLDQVRDGRTYKQQHMQVGMLTEDILQQGRAAQPGQIRFHQHTALLWVQARRSFEERLGIRIREDLYPISVQQGRQPFSDCLIRIHNVDRKFVVLQ